MRRFLYGTQSYLALSESIMYSMIFSSKPVLSIHILAVAEMIEIIVLTNCCIMILFGMFFLKIGTFNTPVKIKISITSMGKSSKSN